MPRNRGGRDCFESLRSALLHELVHGSSLELAKDFDTLTSKEVELLYLYLYIYIYKLYMCTTFINSVVLIFLDCGLPLVNIFEYISIIYIYPSYIYIT